MLRAVLPPLVTAYAIFVAMVGLYLRRPVPPHGHADGSSGAAHLRHVVRTMLGGYVAFLVIVLIFQVWLAGDPDAFASAAWGGAFLSLIALVVAAGSQLIGRRSGDAREASTRAHGNDARADQVEEAPPES